MLQAMVELPDYGCVTKMGVLTVGLKRCMILSFALTCSLFSYLMHYKFLSFYLCVCVLSNCQGNLHSRVDSVWQ